MSEQGILVVVSGFSGAGKGTIMNRLMEKYGEHYALSVSATTRNPRPGEIDGVSYFFKTKEEFEEMIQKEELVEYASYVGNYYGTPKAYVNEQLALGKNVILEIEIQGALNVKKIMPDTKLLFVTTKSAEVLKDRLVGRGTETMDVIEARLSRAYEESQGIENYDYLVVNDMLEDSVDKVHSIIMNEKNHEAAKNSLDTILNNQNFINEMRDELLSFSKGE